MPPIELRKPADGPRLLVSVRSDIEAAAAIAGGADILDVKDPSRGSLGCPEAHVLRAICLKSATSAVPVTTALGEASDWMHQDPFAIPDGVAFAKLGLAGLGEDVDWIEKWLAVRRRFETLCPGIKWVAVAYVDYAAAASPPIADVAAAAIDTGCAGLLLDTCDKSAEGLFDFVSMDQLDELAERMHSEERFIAVAGRLSLSDIAHLASCPVDVVAVRSAACDGSDRQGGVTEDRVAACGAALRGQLVGSSEVG